MKRGASGIRFRLAHPFTHSLQPETARDFHDQTLSTDAHKTAHVCSVCGPKFCSMQVTQEIRDELGTAWAPNFNAETEKGMAEKAEEFKRKGGEINLRKE